MRTNEPITAPTVDSAPTDKLALALKVLAADMKALIAETSDQAGRGVAELRARGDTSRTAALARLAEVPRVAWSKAASAGRTADGYLRTHRWEVLAISAVAGFVAGAVLARHGHTET